MATPGLLDGADPRPVHFVGIGGAGMSALAELFVRRGLAVTGCDANPAGASDLVVLGVSVARGHDAAHVRGRTRRRLLVGDPARSPGARRAHARLGLPVIRRAEALADAVRGGRLVGIAGTHGKTTTTVMTTDALASAGLIPRASSAAASARGRATFAGAGAMSSSSRRTSTTARSSRSIPRLPSSPTSRPTISTSIATSTTCATTFARYISHATYLVVCADDAGASSLPAPHTAAGGASTASTSPSARLVARDVRVEAGTTVFCGLVRRRVHAARSASRSRARTTCATRSPPSASASCGASPSRRWRRGSRRSGASSGASSASARAGGVAVIDDYAHHPTEIRATLAAARSAYPGRRIVVAFQPHLFTRTRDFAGEFGEALAGADPSCSRASTPRASSRSRESPATWWRPPSAGAGGNLAWHGDRAELANALLNVVRPGDVVLTVGAGDITRTGGELLARLGP